MARAVATGRALLCELTQQLRFGHGCAGRIVGIGRARIRRQVGGDQAQVERTRPTQLRCGAHDPRIASEATRLFGPRTQMRLTSGGQPPVELVQAAPGSHRCERGGEVTIGRAGVVHVVGRDRAHPCPDGQLGESIVAHRVGRHAVVPQLHEGVLGAEGCDQAAQLPFRRSRTLRHQCGRHRSLAAPGEHRPVPPSSTRRRLGQISERHVRSPLLPCHLRRRQQRRQPAIALDVASQHQQVPTGRIGGTGPRLGRVECQLCTEHRGQAQLPSGLGEADDAVEPVVVGDRQGVQLQASGLFGQGLGLGCAVQEGERRVAVQLRVPDPVGR